MFKYLCNICTAEEFPTIKYLYLLRHVLLRLQIKREGGAFDPRPPWSDAV